MKIINTKQAQKKLYQLIEKTALEHQPILITGTEKNAVLISQEDWNAMEETLYLLSIPDMRQSIINGLQEDPNKCAKDLEW